MRELFDTALIQKGKLLTENYLEVQRLATLEYGEKSVVVIEIGSFFEIYESEEIGVASEISNFLNIVLTKKNKSIREVTPNNPRLCGIPSVSMDKYIEKLVEDNWTIILVTQKESVDGFYRSVDKIITPGTNIDYLKDDNENYLASVHIETQKNKQISIGLSLLEPTLGIVKTFEGHGTFSDKTSAFDEMMEILEKSNISELLCYSDIEYPELNYLDIDPIRKDIKNSKISYQNQLFKDAFSINHDYLDPIEVLDLEREPFASQSLTNLLQYVFTNNKLVGTLLTNINKIESNQQMKLGNNPMHQLDIQNKNIQKDLIGIVNKGVSAIGKRFITNRLLNPVTSRSEIEGRLNDSVQLIESGKDISTFRTAFKKIYDIERIYRKFEMNKIEPYEVLNLYKSIKSINEVSIERDFSELLSEFKDFLSLDELESITWNSWSQNFLLNCDDELINEYESLNLSLKELTESAESFGGKLKYSPTEGHFIELSNKSKNLKEFDNFDKKVLKNSTKFTNDNLRNVSTLLNQVLEKIKIENQEKLYLFLAQLDKNEIQDVVNEICYLEFAVNNIKLMTDLDFTIPEIIDSETNYFEAIELRHPIVEFIDREKFVPNTVQFGKIGTMSSENYLNLSESNHQGYVLFGQNSSGKTVLSKSVGIAIILAQSGFFVPAKYLKLSIYDSLFTRIVGSDDLAKGKSTFAMEMTELRNILKRGTNRSMVIGDEISHGTETTSGLSIVAATIFSLTGSFILSTHLHELDKISGIDELDHVKMVHLSLNYSKDDDKIVYNRKLQIGKGGSTYGLEFAKSIHLPEEFINKAYEIRSEVEDKISGIEELAKEKTSRYNKDVFYGSCELCGGKAEEIHHIEEQLDARSGKVSKNKIHSKNNLMNLCKACHDNEHK